MLSINSLISSKVNGYSFILMFDKWWNLISTFHSHITSGIELRWCFVIVGSQPLKITNVIEASVDKKNHSYMIITWLLRTNFFMVEFCKFLIYDLVENILILKRVQVLGFILIKKRSSMLQKLYSLQLRVCLSHFTFVF